MTRNQTHRRVAHAFDLAGVTSTVSAPSFAFLAKDGAPQTHTRRGLCGAAIGVFSPRDSLSSFGRMNLPFDATRRLPLSSNPDAGCGGFGRDSSGGERGGI